VRANVQSLHDIKQKQNYQTSICQTHTCQHWVQMFHPYLILKITKQNYQTSSQDEIKYDISVARLVFVFDMIEDNGLYKTL
jgi:hypothetical protein